MVPVQVRTPVLFQNPRRSRTGRNNSPVTVYSGWRVFFFFFPTSTDSHEKGRGIVEVWLRFVIIYIRTEFGAVSVIPLAASLARLVGYSISV